MCPEGSVCSPLPAGGIVGVVALEPGEGSPGKRLIRQECPGYRRQDQNIQQHPEHTQIGGKTKVASHPPGTPRILSAGPKYTAHTHTQPEEALGQRLIHQERPRYCQQDQDIQQHP